ncbi:MAG TPA: rhomboid family intramembrane serine protease [Sandaracinaceae bacterium LLY-WYZ-13_1]|nr:rhomboid family intramembrane serine protease [Sandaracinaceae bacterium LLY-WYZ-13_1]
MPTRRWPLPVFASHVVLPAWLLLPVLVIGYAVADAALRPHVAWAAHVGGFLVGALVGLPLRRWSAPAWHDALEEGRRARLERS